MYAAENISRTTDARQNSLVTKWVAYGLASHVALFEGTRRKYHNLDLPTSAETWLQRAVDAASVVMEESGKSLHENYGAVFTSDDPHSSDTMLALASDAALGVTHNRE